MATAREFLIEKGKLPSNVETLAGDIQKTGVSEMFGKTGKKINVGGQDFFWSGGQLLDLQGGVLGSAPEAQDSVNVVKGILGAAGFDAGAFGINPLQEANMATELGFSGMTGFEDDPGFKGFKGPGQFVDTGIGQQKFVQEADLTPEQKAGGQVPEGFVKPQSIFDQQPGMGIAAATPGAKGLVWVKDPKTGLQLQMNEDAANAKVSQGWSIIQAPSEAAPGEVKAGGLLKPSDIAQGTSLTEDDIARTTGVNIYRRDLAKEQAKLGDWIKLAGSPKNDQDWLAFHDFVYEGKMPGSAEGIAGGQEGVIGAGEATPVVNPADYMGTVGTGSKALTDFQNFANGYLTGADAYINKIAQERQAKAASDLKVAEGELAGAKAGFEAAAEFNPQVEFEKQLEERKYNENLALLNGALQGIAQEKESMQLGILQEGDRIAPMTLIGRRQKGIEERGIARIGALTSIAEIYQGNMSQAMEIAKTSTNYLSDFYRNQQDTYQTLMDLAKDDVIRLDSKEQEFLNLQMELVKSKEEKLEANKEKVTNLILDNPKLAQAGGVTFADSYEEAAKKIANQMAISPGSSEIEYEYKDGKWYALDKTNNTVREVNTGSGELLGPVNAGDYGGQCGTWARQQYSSIAGGEGMGDTFVSKKAWVESHGTRGIDGLQVGDLVITNESTPGTETGHAFIVGAIEDGMITAYESNYNGDELITNNREIPLNSDRIYGYVSGQLNDEFNTDSGIYDDNIEFSYNEKIDFNKLPKIGTKKITDKSARQSNLPFGITQEQANWIMERRPGNIEFQRLNGKEYEKVGALLELLEDIDQIKDLKKEVNTGPFSSRSARASRFAGLDVGKFTELEIKTGKQLAEYIKDISGAAVSEQEAQRLARNIPNVNMQDDQFITAVEDFQDDLNNTILTVLNRYDIEDEETLRNAVGLGKDIIKSEDPLGFSSGIVSEDDPMGIK